MTLAQLRYAVAVDTHRHFGKAAAACHVSQPTLSAQLMKLEDELGIVLFDRSRQPVIPTDLGAQILAQARQALAECSRIPRLIEDHSGEVRGELRLGVIPTIASNLLPLVTGPFGTRHPAATLSIREIKTEPMLREIATGQLDAGLIATPDVPAGLTARPLFSEPFVAYVGAGHWAADEAAVACRSLTVEDVWLLSEGHCFRDQVLHLCGSAPPANPDAPGPAARRIQFESGNLETLRRMVDRSGGVTLLPRMATLYMTEDERRHVRPLMPPVPSRTVRMVYGRAYLKRTLIDAYVDTVLDTVGAVQDVTPLEAGPAREG